MHQSQMRVGMLARCRRGETKLVGSDMFMFDRESPSNTASGGLILLRSLRLGQRVWSVELEIKQRYLSVFVC